MGRELLPALRFNHTTKLIHQLGYIYTLSIHSCVCCLAVMHYPVIITANISGKMPIFFQHTYCTCLTCEHELWGKCRLQFLQSWCLKSPTKSRNFGFLIDLKLCLRQLGQALLISRSFFHISSETKQSALT